MRCIHATDSSHARRCKCCRDVRTRWCLGTLRDAKTPCVGWCKRERGYGSVVFAAAVAVGISEQRRRWSACGTAGRACGGRACSRRCRTGVCGDALRAAARMPRAWLQRRPAIHDFAARSSDKSQMPSCVGVACTAAPALAPMARYGAVNRRSSAAAHKKPPRHRCRGGVWDKPGPVQCRLSIGTKGTFSGPV
jgi:hypothetical protein